MVLQQSGAGMTTMVMAMDTGMVTMKMVMDGVDSGDRWRW